MTRQVLRWDPYVDPYEGSVRFRLTYEGQLLASANKSHPANKHVLRKRFHSQLEQLWRRHAELAELAQMRFPDYEVAMRGKDGGPFNGPTTPYAELLQNTHGSYGHKWLPLVVAGLDLSCSVEILFLRHGAKNNVFNKGDIDGRLKTIFDALAIPTSASCISAPDYEGPTYVLLQDDSLITHVAVEADELFEPTGDVPINEDARVVITVHVKMRRPNWMTLRFAGD